MADTRATKAAIQQYANRVQRRAADRIETDLARRTPYDTGRLDRARTRRDSQRGTVATTRLASPAGAGEPEGLPEWLDKGRSFVIRPRRARALRFRVGGRTLFRRRVVWRPKPGSVGYWSQTVNARRWRDALTAAARGQRLP